MYFVLVDITLRNDLRTDLSGYLQKDRRQHRTLCCARRSSTRMCIHERHDDERHGNRHDEHINVIIIK